MVQTSNENKALRILQNLRAEFLTCLQQVAPVEMHPVKKHRLVGHYKWDSFEQLF